MIAQFLRSIGRSLRQWVWRSRPPQANRPPSPVRRRPRNVLALTRWNASGELGLPYVVGRVRDAQLVARVFGLLTALDLLQRRADLILGELAFAHLRFPWG